MQQRYAEVLLKNLDVLYKHHKQVAIKIESYWGTELCHRYIKYLLVKECVNDSTDPREDRVGFEYDVYVVILTLYVLHVKLYTDFGHPVTLHNPNLKEYGLTVQEAVADLTAESSH